MLNGTKAISNGAVLNPKKSSAIELCGTIKHAKRGFQKFSVTLDTKTESGRQKHILQLAYRGWSEIDLDRNVVYVARVPGVQMSVISVQVTTNTSPIAGLPTVVGASVLDCEWLTRSKVRLYLRMHEDTWIRSPVPGLRTTQVQIQVNGARRVVRVIEQDNA